MKNKQLRFAVALAGLLSSASAMAIDPPTIARPLADGATYTLVNYAKPSVILSRTSWDGAYYLLDFDKANYKKHAFVAHQDDEGWYFSSTDSTYIGFNTGNANLNGNLTAPAHFTVTASEEHPGFYRIVNADDQPCEGTHGLPVHLNNGGQFLVTTFNGNQYFPDYMGGCEMMDDSTTPVIDTETGWIHPLDTSHELWAFADTADVPQYQQRISLYTLITDLQQQQLAEPEEGFAEGWQALVDAATTLYNQEAVSQEDNDAAKRMKEAKTSLYDEIKKAQAMLGEDIDATFQAAIGKALLTFNTSTDPAQQEEAQRELVNAEVIFNGGQGDITNLGQNMSFEDLTAQGGAETTGVGPTPTGWNAYVDGKQIVTADDARAAGFTAWYGVNSDSQGESKDGNETFGVWNQHMPAFELSQTITGLDNGTYRIEAAVMVGANNQGSRRTTQRVFGNLNSTLFGQQGDYDPSLFDPLEVLAYAGNNELTTDRELQNVTCDAYVYDGTLTFGFRTDGNIAAAKRTAANPQGGDGWFKVDNFRIAKMGYVKETALNVYNFYYDKLMELNNEKMQEKVATALQTTLDNNYIDDDATPEAIDAAIMACKDAITPAANSVALYKKLEAALEEHYNNLNDYALYDGYEAYRQAVEDEAEVIYDDATAGEEEINAAIAKMEAALEACKLGGVKVGSEATMLIKNPSFEDLTAQGGEGSESGGVAAPPTGWTLYINGKAQDAASVKTHGMGWCAINTGDVIDVIDNDGTWHTQQPTDGTHLWGIWASNIPEVQLSQTITGLPKGTYLLKADVMVQNNWAGNNVTTQRIFGNSCVEMWGEVDGYTGNVTADMQAAIDFDAQALDTLKHITYAGYTCESGDATTSLLKPMQLYFDVQEDGVATIGFRTNGVNKDGGTFAEKTAVNGAGWFKVDNFRLFFINEESHVSGINGINGDGTGEVTRQEFYSIDGQRLPKPRKGVVIVKSHLANGKTIVGKTVVK
ncbi:MAG TPA: hypothetical protein DD401_03110 [Prevotella sp.]|nr:hypothetical protein [Prevotella sp.]